jgi:hypothetical protein
MPPPADPTTIRATQPATTPIAAPTPPTSSGGSRLVPVLVGVLVLAIVGLGVTLAVMLTGRNRETATDHTPTTSRLPEPTDPSPTQPTDSVTTPTVTVTVTVTVTTPTVAPPPPPTVTMAPLDAVAQLNAYVAQDEGRVASELEGHWVPQLSTKWVGVQDQGITWDAPAILAEHERLRQQYDAVIVDSSQWGFRRKGAWVTLAPVPFDSGDAANAWCVAQGRSRNDCFAKLIHRGSAFSGDTKNR